jgi:S-methylmethionine-dependent homocysteine/selenocysteine methylase
MSKYRTNLPQLNGNLFLTDGGIETTLIFHEGFDLPLFSAFVLLEKDEGRAALDKYFSTYARIAQQNEVGFVLESATWRANPDWAGKLGYSLDALADVNRKSIDMLTAIREQFENERSPMVISGCIGPRDDGYNPSVMMTAEEAEQYHATQIETFKDTAADMVTAITMTYVEEAIGVTRAAQAAGIPVVISFTLETDGCLPSGTPLKDAIEAVDAATGSGPAYYMINCAHPTHFADKLSSGEDWVSRLRGLRANASSRSHEELDEAEDLDEGNPVELGQQYRELFDLLPNLTVLGGCCGTDHRHIEQACLACAPQT